ncbi:hypothetical protein LR48_Vigan10g179800 [Vigna angularis]|uniref:Uncharacterized protein n=1 Tax=Phaseolus angularis TaxID=3914 RepID=A0A0L9VLG6_PHAAN|nr:hypothetical protein LR48_Vigan10g179800 [Vigna angularis]
MKGDCYPDLVEVFYKNLRVVSGVIHSRVKGVNITIDDNVWSHIAGLKAKGLDSHICDSESNRWLTKRAIYVNCLRYPRTYTVDKQVLHDGLNKEEKLIAYVLTWLLLPGRFVEDRMSTEDVFLLNAIKTRIPTNWVAVLILQGVDVSQEVRLVCNKSQKIGILSLFSIGLERTVNGWFFRDELTVGSTPTPAIDHTAFIPQTDFEKYVVDQFRKKSEGMRELKILFSDGRRRETRMALALKLKILMISQLMKDEWNLLRFKVNLVKEVKKDRDGIRKELKKCKRREAISTAQRQFTAERHNEHPLAPLRGESAAEGKNSTHALTAER